MDRVVVDFQVNNLDRFQQSLQRAFEGDDNVIGLRSDTAERLRPALARFADAMEAKLKKNDYKTDWVNLPIEALFKFLMVEIEEFKVAYEFRDHISLDQARAELVDVANFCLILWDRISKEPKATTTISAGTVLQDSSSNLRETDV